VQLPADRQQRIINVVVVSSVALAFISFWRAAAIVLCDLASTAYYIGGISEQAIGKAAPWFILGVMLFSYAVRAVYVESCTMFTRGGVYKVVKEAMGGSLAKLSVSALMFDYILTGPISAVSAGQYIVGLFIDMINLINAHNGHAQIDPTRFQGTINFVTVAIAIFITIYFWRINIIGIHESSDKALRIMQLTTIMGVIIIGWSVLTMLLKPHGTVHAPPATPVFTPDSLGWLSGLTHILGPLGIIIAFGHSLLAMSGEESLAQVNREIEAPKLKNLLRAGFVIFLYSLLLTSLISFFAVLIIPDGKRVATFVVPQGQSRTDSSTQVDYLRPGDQPGTYWGYRLDNVSAAEPTVTTEKVVVGTGTGLSVERDNGGYRDNLINGLVQYLWVPASWVRIGQVLKIAMECFVVGVGFLILAGAVNTSIVGSNGVMNRLAEDGVLTPWFLHPQRRFGTTHRLINLVVILQLVTIVASWGDVNTLGEAYAFGVIWSFVFKTLAMVVLRFRDRSPRQYEVPLNIRIGRRLPVAMMTAGNGNGHSNGNGNGHGYGVPSEAVPANGVTAKPAIASTPTQIALHNGAAIDLPIGITLIFLILLSTAMINLVTKKTATIWGVGFTVAFLAAFIILEQISHRRRGGGHHQHLEQFNESATDKVNPNALKLEHEHPILVAVRNPGSLQMLNQVLQQTDTTQRDVVVVTCKVLPPMTQGVTPQERSIQEVDRTVLTRVVTVAEEAGKQIHPLVIPTNNPLFAIASAARDLRAQDVVLGESEKVPAETLAEQFAMAWGIAMGDTTGEQPLTLRIVGEGREARFDL
jgi:hypothetical protein